MNDYFRLFIIATGCPSEQCPQKTVSYYGVHSARIHTLPQFQVASETQLIIVRLNSLGNEPTTSSFHVERTNH